MGETTKSFAIRDYPENDRPRERLENLGESALTSAELLAILLRVGVEGLNAIDLARELINQFGSLRGLHAASFADLCAVRGMGRAKTAQIKAAIELGYRLSLEEEKQAEVISKPEDVHKIMGHLLSGKIQEELWVLLLNTRNRLISKHQLYIGTINHSSVRLAEVLELPLRKHAAALLLVHNHPSGDPQPSEEDIRLTEEIIKAGRLLDINVLDHIVIARDGFISIRRSGNVTFSVAQSKSWQ